MKSFIQVVSVAAMLAVPVMAFAQSKASANNATTQTATATAYGGEADGASVLEGPHALRSLDRAVHRVGSKTRSSIRTDANDGMEPIYFGS
jgi:hypothetical protein